LRIGKALALVSVERRVGQSAAMKKTPLVALLIGLSGIPAAARQN